MEQGNSEEVIEEFQQFIEENHPEKADLWRRRALLMREIKKISNMYVDKPFQMTDDSLERFKSATSHSEMKNTVKSG